MKPNRDPAGPDASHRARSRGGRRRLHRALAAAVMALAGWLHAAPPAIAQSSSSTASGTALEQAREKYQRGAEAYKAGRYQEAIDRFLEADHLASSPAFAFNVAVAYEDMGDRARALHWFRTYVRRLPTAKDRADVERRIGRLQNELRAKGVQQVSVESTPEGAEVALDGKSVGVTPWAGELAPGKHLAVARLKGHQEARQEFLLAADQSMSVTIPLAPAPSATPAGALPTERGQEPATPMESPGIRPLTWISLGVGVAALGGAIGFELARAAAEDEARSAATQLDAADAAGSMEDRRTVARVLLTVGAAATLAGGVLLIVDLTRDPVPQRADGVATPRLRAGLGCKMAGCSAALHGAF